MFAQLLHILKFLRYPDAAVVAQGFAHKGEFALLLTVYRDTGWMDLREARISEICTLLPALYGCRTVAVHCIGGKEICVAVTTGCDNYSVCTEPFELTGYKVAGYDTLCFTVHDYEVQHLVARI